MKEKEIKDYIPIFIGNYFGFGQSYDGSVFKKTVSPTLMASNANGNVPKFIIVEKE